MDLNTLTLEELETARLEAQERIRLDRQQLLTIQDIIDQRSVKVAAQKKFDTMSPAEREAFAALLQVKPPAQISSPEGIATTSTVSIPGS